MCNLYLVTILDKPLQHPMPCFRPHVEKLQYLIKIPDTSRIMSCDKNWVWLQTAVADDPTTTNWIDQFDACTHYSKSTARIYAERGRYDACAVPERASETLCTWIAALGRACSHRHLFVDWMTDKKLYDYCTSTGIFLLWHVIIYQLVLASSLVTRYFAY